MFSLEYFSYLSIWQFTISTLIVKMEHQPHMRLVHLKTGHFGGKVLTSYMVFLLITRTAAGPLWNSLVCDILMVGHNLRREKASSFKYFHSSDRLNHIIWKPAVALVFKWTNLIYILIMTLLRTSTVHTPIYMFIHIPTPLLSHNPTAL